MGSWPLNRRRHGEASMRRLVRITTLLVVVIAACKENPVEPPATQPPEPVDTAFTRYGGVAAGGDHTCAFNLAGRMHCWGLGSNGRLGIGVLDTVAFLPTPVTSASVFFSVDAGAAHVCGIGAGGALHCWGLANYGQVGNRSSEPRSEPFHVREPPFTFVAVTTGGYHSCALGEDFRGFCWGANGMGQLGTGSPHGEGVPAPVAGNHRFAMISAGGEHTCGVTVEGEAYCWGRGTEGQLGTGDAESRLSPARLASGVTFNVISAGARHTCGIASDGRAYCWGAGSVGQLGTGTLASATTPAAVLAETRFTAVSAGEEHTCAISTAGRMYCWGHNNFGRLGRQSLPAAQPEPAPVDGDIEFGSVSVGRLHTCAIARYGALYCWGFGGFGQLGNGMVLSRSAPTRVGEPAPPR
jgi:alpha-tubulin suppressor-like RCC1 family protein